MSKFKKGKVFVIINDADITTEMVNYSTSETKDSMPIKNVAGVDKRILETSEPVPSIYAAYIWYSLDNINSVWDAL